MTVPTILITCAGLFFIIAAFHFLRAGFPVPPESRSQPAEMPRTYWRLSLVDEDPGLFRVRLHQRLDRKSGWAFLMAGLVLLGFSLSSWYSRQELPWVKIVLLWGGIFLVEAGVRAVIGIRYVERIKGQLQAQYRSKWRKHPWQETDKGKVDFSLLKEQLTTLLTGYVTDEEMEYMLDTYRMKIEDHLKGFQSSDNSTQVAPQPPDSGGACP